MIILHRVAELPSGRADERWGCRLLMMTGKITLGLLADNVVALAEIYRLPMLRLFYNCSAKRRPSALS